MRRETKTCKTHSDSQKPGLHWVSCSRSAALAQSPALGCRSEAGKESRQAADNQKERSRAKVWHESTGQAFWEKMPCGQNNLFFSNHRWRFSILNFFIIEEFYFSHWCQNRIQPVTQVNTVFYQHHQCRCKCLLGLNTMALQGGGGKTNSGEPDSRFC